MADTKVMVSPDSPTEIGDIFRITFNIHSHYDVQTVNKIIRCMKYGEGLIDLGPFHIMQKNWKFYDITAESDQWVNGTPYSSQGQPEDWRLIVEAERIGGGTPLAVVIALIIAVLLALALVMVVTGWTAEKLGKSPAGIAVALIPLAIAAVAFLYLMKRG